LTFAGQPASAQAGSVITTTDFNSPPGGQIEVSGASPNATVTIAIASSTPSGATLSGTTKVRADNEGNAFFGDLSIALHGTDTLLASSKNASSATSSSFTIWDVAQSCKGNQPCNANFSQTNVQSVSESGTSSSDGFLLLSVGQDTVNCGDTFSHAPKATTASTSRTFNGSGPKTVSVTIPKSQVQILPIPNNGAGNYAVCYQGGAFTDINGNPVAAGTPGLLPDCKKVTPANTPPCVVSISKTGAGNLVETILVPNNDPKFA